MYTVLDNTEMMTRDEVKAKYDGRWIFLTNCEFSQGNMLLRGIPRIIADKQYEGVDLGIYNVYDNKELYGETTSYTLLELDYLIKTISFVPKGAICDGDISV
jgi:hypothetical protein